MQQGLPCRVPDGHPGDYLQQSHVIHPRAVNAKRRITFLPLRTPKSREQYHRDADMLDCIKKFAKAVEGKAKTSEPRAAADTAGRQFDRSHHAGNMRVALLSTTRRKY